MLALRLSVSATAVQSFYPVEPVRLVPSFLFGSSLFLEVTRTSITSRMCSNFDQIRPLTAELSALECLKNQYFVLWPL